VTPRPPDYRGRPPAEPVKVFYVSVQLPHGGTVMLAGIDANRVMGEAAELAAFYSGDAMGRQVIITLDRVVQV
jgi:hypothetical protein